MIYSGTLNSPQFNNLTSIIFEKSVLNKLSLNTSLSKPENHIEDIVGLVNEKKIWLQSEKHKKYENTFRPITGLDPN